MSSPAESVTHWLCKWNGGDPDALDEVMKRTYDDLRRLARHHLRSERPDHTLQPTALVHEVYLQLSRATSIDWRTRAQFIATSAQVMRHILIDHARKRRARKRQRTLQFCPGSGRQFWDLLVVDEALALLEKTHSRAARIVELHFFGGLSLNECAQVLSASGEEVSLRTAERDWRFARAWLSHAVAHGRPDSLN